MIEENNFSKVGDLPEMPEKTVLGSIGAYVVRGHSEAAMRFYAYRAIHDIESKFSSILPRNCCYMDEPDGGSPSIFDQFSRMAEDASKWRALDAGKEEELPELDTVELVDLLSGYEMASGDIQARAMHRNSIVDYFTSKLRASSRASQKP